jgi:hypothetical protein
MSILASRITAWALKPWNVTPHWRDSRSASELKSWQICWSYSYLSAWSTGQPPAGRAVLIILKKMRTPQVNPPGRPFLNLYVSAGIFACPIFCLKRSTSAHRSSFLRPCYPPPNMDTMRWGRRADTTSNSPNPLCSRFGLFLGHLWTPEIKTRASKKK